jgi:hypothetical protein
MVSLTGSPHHEGFIAGSEKASVAKSGRANRPLVEMSAHLLRAIRVEFVKTSRSRSVLQVAHEFDDADQSQQARTPAYVLVALSLRTLIA